MPSRGVHKIDGDDDGNDNDRDYQDDDENDDAGRVGRW